MEREVQAAVSSLGCLDGNKYEKEPDCLETVRDLIRYLRRDTETYSYKVRLQLTSLNVIEKDLIPILRTFPNDSQLFESCLRLLINLTQPINEKRTNPDVENIQTTQSNAISERLQLLSGLKRTKRAFIDSDFFSVIIEKLNLLLGLDWEQQQEEDRLLVERLLILIRNILHIPPPDEDLSEKTSGDLTMHDQLLLVMHKIKLDDLILDLACAESQREFHVNVMEIMALLLRYHAPEVLATTGTERSQILQRREQQELANIQAKEASKRTEQLRRCSGRSATFAGSYLVCGLKGLSGSKNLAVPRPIIKGEDLSFDARKHPKKTPRNRAPAKETLADLPAIFSSSPCSRRSALEVRLILKEFCGRFCEIGYNKFMHSIQYALERREATADGGSRYHFWWLMRYFMTFVRHGGCSTDDQLKWKFVSETLSLHCLHEAQIQLEECMENIKMEKKEARQWARKAHVILKAYGELLMMIQKMENSSDEDAIDAALELKKTLFYVLEYREILITIFKKYNPIAYTKLFLKDLVEITHVYLKMLETHCLVYGDELMVQNKRKRKRQRKRKEPTGDEQNKDEQLVGGEGLTEEQKRTLLEEAWQNIVDDLSSLLAKAQKEPNVIPKDVVVFDPLAEHGFDDKIVAQVRIQKALKTNEVTKAVALLYLSREIWPDEVERFGQLVQPTPEDDFLLLRKIFFMEMPEIPGENVKMQNVEDNVNQMGQQQEDVHAEMDDLIKDADQDSDENDEAYVTSEVQFSFNQYVNRFAHGDILRWYISLLDDFPSNTAQLNHCLTKMMHRISYDLKMAPLLYQARLFRSLHKMFAVPGFSNSAGATELNKFAKHFLTGFFAKATKQPMLFVEMLFRKGFKEAYEIDYGYGSYQEKKKTKSKSKKDRKRSSGSLSENEPNYEQAEPLFEPSVDGEIDLVQPVAQSSPRSLTSHNEEVNDMNDEPMGREDRKEKRKSKSSKKEKRRTSVKETVDSFGDQEIIDFVKRTVDELWPENGEDNEKTISDGDSSDSETHQLPQKGNRKMASDDDLSDFEVDPLPKKRKAVVISSDED